MDAPSDPGNRHTDSLRDTDSYPKWAVAANRAVSSLPASNSPTSRRPSPHVLDECTDVLIVGVVDGQTHAVHKGVTPQWKGTPASKPMISSTARFTSRQSSQACRCRRGGCGGYEQSASYWASEARTEFCVPMPKSWR